MTKLEQIAHEMNMTVKEVEAAAAFAPDFITIDMESLGDMASPAKTTGTVETRLLYSEEDLRQRRDYDRTPWQTKQDQLDQSTDRS